MVRLYVLFGRNFLGCRECIKSSKLVVSVQYNPLLWAECGRIVSNVAWLNFVFSLVA